MALVICRFVIFYFDALAQGNDYKSGILQKMINALWDVGLWFKCLLVNCVAAITFLSISSVIALRWMLQYLTDDKLTLVEVMVWCRQAISQ